MSIERIFGRVMLILFLTVGVVAGCKGLMAASPTAPPRTDTAVTVPVGDEATIVVAGTGVERPSTLADDAVDTATSIGSAVTGNPLLWGLAAQLAHLAIGAVGSRRKDPA